MVAGSQTKSTSGGGDLTANRFRNPSPEQTPEASESPESVGKARNYSRKLDRFDRLGHVHLIACR
jgi:hypothetical protein